MRLAIIVIALDVVFDPDLFGKPHFSGSCSGTLAELSRLLKNETCPCLQPRPRAKPCSAAPNAAIRSVWRRSYGT